VPPCTARRETGVVLGAIKTALPASVILDLHPELLATICSNPGVEVIQRHFCRDKLADSVNERNCF